MDTKQVVKNLELESNIVDEETGTAEVIINTGGVDRDNEMIDLDGMSLENFFKNPVLLAQHEQHKFPIGKFTNIWRDERGLVGKVKFAVKESKLAKEAYNLIKGGFLKAVSVGFRPIDAVKDEKSGLLTYTKSEMLEASIVSIPADPGAGVVAVKAVKNFKEMLVGEINAEEKKEKQAIPYKKAAKKAKEDAIWDGPAEAKKAEGKEQLRNMHAWVDTKGNQEKPAAYRLPYKKANGTIVWAGVRTAMASLLGARGEVVIPEEDRKAVYDVLVKGYEEFGKEAPQLKEYSEKELQKMFELTPLESEQDMILSVMQKAIDRLKTCNYKSKELDDETRKNYTEKAYELSKIITELSERSNANLRVKRQVINKVRVKIRQPEKVKLKIKE